MSITAMSLGCYQKCPQGLEIEAAIADQVPERGRQDYAARWRLYNQVKQSLESKRPIMDGKKPCPRCGRLLELDHFRFDKKLDRYESWCKECKAEYHLVRRPKQEKPVIPEGYKQCSRCKRIQPESEFYFDRRNGGLTSHCKTCQAEYGKIYNAKRQKRRLPFLCKVCGTSSPENFLGQSKSLCSKCAPGVVIERKCKICGTEERERFCGFRRHICEQCYQDKRRNA